MRSILAGEIMMMIAKPSGWILKKIVLLALILSALAAPPLVQKARADLNSAPKQRILVLHSYHYGFTWSDKISEGIRSTLQEHKNQIELIFEFLDARRIYTDEYFAKFRELFKVKYADRKIDVIICSDDHALNFAIKQDLFSDLPLVFCSISGYDPRMRRGRKLTGLQESIEIKATMDTALTLHPGTRQVAVITDMPRTGRALKQKANKVFKEYEPRISFAYLEDLTVDELKSRVSELPTDTIIFLFIFSRDKDGRVLSHEHNLKILRDNCNLPIYAAWEFYLGHGIMGGKLTSGMAEGKAAAKLALRILQGENASDIPLQKSPTQYMFDYEQLKRFNISASSLPIPSLIINKPFSFYETFKRLTWGVIGVISVLIVIITVLLYNIRLRKRAEASLIVSEEKFSTAFSAGPDAILITAVDDGKVIDANEQFFNTTGYTRDGVIGKTAKEINNWAIANDRQVFVDTLQKTGHVDNMETYFRHKDGTKAPYLISARRIKISDGNCIISITRDISDRKKYEETLHQYERIVDTSNDLMSLIDFKYVYQAVNETYLNAYKKRREEIIGYSVQEFLGEDVFEKTVRANLGRCFTGETVNYESWFEFPGWGKRYMVVTYYPFFNEDKIVIGVVVNSRDITRTTQLEAQLMQSQKLEALGTLAGGIAHDFNNLLMGIQGRTNLITQENSSDTTLEHLKEIDAHIKSASDLTRQLLGFARGGKYETKPINLNDLVTNTANMFGRTKKELTINKKFHTPLWPVEADQRQIEQVLLNLLVNSWQAMPDGGTIYLQTKNTVVDDNYSPLHQVNPGRFVKLTITDTGVGMDAATQHRIFDPFFTTKEIGRGTGLGLASVYGIIKNHGGAITVYSEKNRGATFDIYLPASEKEVIVAEAVNSQVEKGNEMILLVDDERLIVDVGKPMLENLGYRVLSAESGKEAVEIIREKKDEIDMVILDMIMPQIDGEKAYELIKEISPNMKVLLSSGYSVDGQAQKILNKGCNGFIQKPFSMVELSRKIRTIIDQ
jgi:PAS domain S-box-containing protein